jgi:anti-sigma factor ChrR (cupin superfamily)
MDDVYTPLVEAYALAALDEPERADFEAHLGAGCEGCRKAVSHQLALVEALPRGLSGAVPAAVVRTQLLDLAEAPTTIPDLGSLSWDEVVPGVRVHVVKDDPSRGMRACLVWAKPGACHPRHRHLGDEIILVLQGSLGDERAEYGPGDICRSRTGSTHSERALPGDDCVCFVIYYGGLEMLEEPPSA